MTHVAAIATEPHPMGSPQAEKVREYITATLGELGLRPEIQSFKVDGVEGKNLLARIKGNGPEGKKALMLCAHYDSTPKVRARGRQCLGVSLPCWNLVRALKSGPSLERDLILLIDDGEEGGLHGAEAFVRDHPWAKDVGLVVNLDARGNRGPSVMFETSEGNGWLIAEFAKAVPHPLAASLSMDVYRLLPNDTNMTVFKRAGMAGLNFAFVGGLSAYHTPDDTPANLSHRTLQHQGENGLAMARHFGTLDLDGTTRQNVIYTTVLNRYLISYPMGLALPLALGALGLYVIVVGVGLVRGRLGLVDLAVGFVAWFIALFASSFAVAVVSMAVRENLMSLGLGSLYLEHDVSIITAFGFVAAVVTLLIERRAARRWSMPGLSLGALAWWVAACLATAKWLPGGSNLILAPTLGCLLGLLVQLLTKPGSYASLVANLVGAIPLLVIITPMLKSLFESLSVRMTGPLMVPVLLYVGALLPLLGPLLAPESTVHGESPGEPSIPV